MRRTISEICKPLFIGREMEMELHDQSLLRPSFIKGHASSYKRHRCRERVSYCNIDDTGAR